VETISCSRRDHRLPALPDTLADVAEYYYVTDLRTTALGNCTSGTSLGQHAVRGSRANGKDLTYNNVPPSGLEYGQPGST